MTDAAPALAFLRCRTPAAWLEQAVLDRDALLLDHASLELKAAQQALKLVWKYGAVARRGQAALDDRLRLRLVNRMSRLAREELRHFEQVVALLERRGTVYRAVSASRYAAGLHSTARNDEPGALVDRLLIGAIIEARSCERFHSLVAVLEPLDAELARFYAALLRAESRHFEDYLDLARQVDSDDVAQRVGALLDRDAELVASPDAELKFHSGTPIPA